MSGAIFTILFSVPLIFFITGDFALTLYVGIALCATSIGITVSVLANFEKLKSEEAQTIIVAAVLDDLLSVILLSLVIDMAFVGTLTIQRLLRILTLTGIFLAILIFGFLIKMYIAPKIWRLKSRGAILVFSFCLALLVSFVAAYIGLSPIVGAYFAGVIFAETEMRDNILTEVSPIALITVPIFLINIGMKISLTSPGKAILMGTILSVLAIFGKLLGGILTGKVQRQERSSSYIMGIGMVPRGEVLLIFADLGLTSGIIDGTWYATLIFVALVTTFITPMFLKYFILREETGNDKSDKNISERDSRKPREVSWQGSRGRRNLDVRR